MPGDLIPLDLIPSDLIPSDLIPSDLIPCGLFLTGILTCLAAEYRLRRAASASWSTGCITVAGASLMVAACAAAIG